MNYWAYNRSSRCHALSYFWCPSILFLCYPSLYWHSLDLVIDPWCPVASYAGVGGLLQLICGVCTLLGFHVTLLGGPPLKDILIQYNENGGQH